jgi:CTP:molybdopterin cytidylyltransferase MocA
LLTPGDIKDLVGAFAASDRSRILIPYFVSRRGNPVLFPADVLAQMRAQGLAPRAFIDAHPELTRVYAAPNDHFVTDMDTPEDLGALSGPQP